MPIKSMIGTAAALFTTQPAQAETSGFAALLNNPTAYEIYLGPNIGSSYAATGFAFTIRDADQVGSTLTVTYPGYANGLLVGSISSDGIYRGTFETTRSAGTFEMRFLSDGPGEGEWRLDDASVARFGINRGVGDTGPNNIRVRTEQP